jgi:hypothetical protein
VRFLVRSARAAVIFRRDVRPDDWVQARPQASKFIAIAFAESSSVVYMTVTSRLFEAYLKCPTKCFLWSRGETGTGNTYADWTHAQNLSCQIEGVTRMKEGVANNECITRAS